MNARIPPVTTVSARRLRHVVVSAIGMLMLGGAAASGESIRILDQLVMGESLLEGEKIGEFSALVRSPDGVVLGISDRGYIAELAIEITDERLVRLQPVALRVLAGPDDAPMRDTDFNPEAATILDDGTIAIASEVGPKLAVFDRDGRGLRAEDVPEPLRDAAKQASEKDGIEALAWTRDVEFVAMTEEPQLGAPRNLHTVHTTLAGSGQIAAEGPESISIKAMEVVGRQLFVLERTRDDVTDALYPFLRIVALHECLATATCVGRQLPIPVKDITDADFEGLVALDDGLFLMVSDDEIDGDLRSVFVLFRLE